MITPDPMDPASFFPTPHQALSEAREQVALAEKRKFAVFPWWNVRALLALIDEQTIEIAKLRYSIQRCEEEF
jgi:hypothetical protein